DEGGYSGCVSGRRGSERGGVRCTGAGCGGGGGAVGLTVVVCWIALVGGASAGISMAISGGGTNGGGVSIFGGGGGGGASCFGASSIMRVSIGPSTTSMIWCDRPEFSSQNIPTCKPMMTTKTRPRRVKNELSVAGA